MTSTADGTALASSLGQLATAQGEFHLKASGLRMGGRLLVAVKIGACFYGRPSQVGLPSIVGVIQLFDGETGDPLAYMESALITKLRTAATTAVAADAFALESASHLAILGAGEQVRPHVEALSAVRPISTVSLWSRRPEQAERQAADLNRQFPDLEFHSYVGVRDATLNAHIVVTLTPSTTPILTRDDVALGAFVAAVGSDAPEKNELALDLLGAASLFCDVQHQCERVGEVHHAIEAGLIAAGTKLPELGEVLSGAHAGRSSPDEIVIYDSTGTAVQDAALAGAVYLDALTGEPHELVDLWK